MNRRTGKLMSLLLALIFVVTLMPVTASAQDQAIFVWEDKSESYGGQIEVGQKVWVNFEGADSQEDSYRWYRKRPGGGDFQYIDDQFYSFNWDYTARPEDVGWMVGCMIDSPSYGQGFGSGTLEVIAAAVPVSKVFVEITELPQDQWQPCDIGYGWQDQSGCSKVDIRWYDNGSPMTQTTPFREGKTYLAVCSCEEADGYRMSESTVLNVNGKDYGTLTYDEMSGSWIGEAEIVCAPNAKNLIPKVALSLSRQPAAGAEGSGVKLSVPKNAPYQISSCEVMTGSETAAGQAWSGGKFSGGTTYWYTVQLKPAGGKKFANPLDVSGIPNVVTGSGTGADPYLKSDGTLTVTLKFTIPSEKHTVTVTGGTATPEKAAKGTEITLSAAPDTDQKKFNRWIVEAGGVKLADEKSRKTTFTMPAADVRITADYNEASKAVITFKIEGGTWDGKTAGTKTVVVPLTNGKGTLQSSLVPTGMKADEGYEGGAWDVTPETGADKITGNLLYTYTFTAAEETSADPAEETSAAPAEEAGSSVPVLWIVIGVLAAAAAVLAGILISKKKKAAPEKKTEEPAEETEDKKE